MMALALYHLAKKDGHVSVARKNQNTKQHYNMHSLFFKTELFVFGEKNIYVQNFRLV